MTEQPRGHVAAHPQGPHQPQAQPLQNIPGAVRRPMSFVKALEMSDQLAVEEQQREQQRQQLQRHRMHPQPPQAQPQMQQLSPVDPVPEEDRQQYGSSYEISV